MKETTIYLLAGKARSGKDTIMTMIKQYYETQNKAVVQLGYADYIKDYAMKITNWDGKDETKPRELLQIIGTDIIRNQIDKDFFIKRICEDITVYKYFFDVIIISGARFPNEIDIPKKLFKEVKAINVERPNFTNELTEKEKRHITEHGLESYNNYDYTIINDGDLEKLKTSVKQMIEEV